MNRDETIDLLTVIAIFDNRQVGKVTVDAWHRVLGDLPIADCLTAVEQHYASSTDWLMPAHVRDLVRRIVTHRQAGADTELPDADPDREADYREGLKRIRRRLGEGVVLPFRAIPAAKAGPSEEWRETREELAARRKAEAVARARTVEAPAEVELCESGHLLDPEGVCRTCEALGESETA